MNNFKKFSQFLFITLILLGGFINTTHAEATDINLTIRSGNTIIYTGAIPLPPAGIIEINSHPLNADSVLSIINNADILSSDFNISNLEYYESFGSFYLKCITSNVGENCDNWQYTVNDTYPGIGMDQKILSGGENIYLYFGPQYKTILSSNSINTSETLTTTAQKYDYQNNTWATRTGVTMGLTQPDPLNPFSPTEVQIKPVDENGQAVFSSILAGSYNVGIKEDFYFPTEALTVVEAPIQTTHSSGSFISNTFIPKTKNTFDSQKALDFLFTQQKDDGSFGTDLYTDWATLALTANSEKSKTQIEKISKYFSNLKTKEYQLTDYERHAMALMSLNLNPYNINNENYIKKVTDSFDGKQFGDIEKYNDDIFALIILQNAGYTKDDQTIKDTVNFILSKQKENGSWDESVDMTGASIQALSTFSSIPGIEESLKKAKNYLKENQQDDGGFGNVSSTAWAIGGIYALSEKPEDWIKNNNTPLDYLTINQDTDGSIKNKDLNNKIWQTSYAVSSLSGKTWNQIMQKFEKPKEEILQKLSLKNSPRTVIAKVKKVENSTKISKTEKEIKNLANQNTANVINSLDTNTEKTNKSWFKNILNKIFSIF